MRSQLCTLIRLGVITTALLGSDAKAKVLLTASARERARKAVRKVALSGRLKRMSRETEESLGLV